MNPKTAKDYLPLVQALADGKMLQILSCGQWVDLVSGETQFCEPADHYRIKPAPRRFWITLYANGQPAQVWFCKDSIPSTCPLQRVEFVEVLK